jgi:hypothetical protein
MIALFKTQMVSITIKIKNKILLKLRIFLLKIGRIMSSRLIITGTTVFKLRLNTF